MTADEALDLEYRHAFPWGDCLIANRGVCRGYGRVRADGRDQLVHRLSLERKLGRPLLPTELACHVCDTKACINPAHLYAGSAADNARDAVQRDLYPRGDRHWRALQKKSRKVAG